MNPPNVAPVPENEKTLAPNRCQLPRATPSCTIHSPDTAPSDTIMSGLTRIVARAETWPG